MTRESVVSSTPKTDPTLWAGPLADGRPGVLGCAWAVCRGGQMLLVPVNLPTTNLHESGMSDLFDAQPDDLGTHSCLRSMESDFPK